MTAAPRRARPLAPLAAVAGVAVAVGLGAALIASAPGSIPKPFSTGTGLLSASALTVLLFAAIAIVVAIVVVALVQSRGPAAPIFSGPLVVGLVVLLALAAGFVVAAHLASPGPPTLVGTGPGPANSTTNGTVPSNATAGLPTGPSVGLFGLSTPVWIVLVIGLVAAIAITLAIAPWAYSRYADRGAREDEPSPDGVEQLVAAAAAELDEGTGDPRASIVRLYRELLRRVDPIVGGVDFDTPEEIRHRHLTRLGIRPTHADRLTRLFETARYSTQPLGAEDAAEARSLLEEILIDLSSARTRP